MRLTRVSRKATLANASGTIYSITTAFHISINLGHGVLNYQKLTNCQLIKECAKYPAIESAWREFYGRFNETIHFYALRECRNSISSREKKQLVEIVQDRVSEVYTKLVAKEHKALKDFIGQNENSIYAYLGVSTRRIVINWVIKEKKTQSRPTIDKSIDDDDENSIEQDRDIMLATPRSEISDKINLDHTKHDIETILDAFLRGKNKDRNKLIFKLHFYEDLTAEEVLQALPYKMTLKTVQNIIANLKRIVRAGLSGGKREPN